MTLCCASTGAIAFAESTAEAAPRCSTCAHRVLGVCSSCARRVLDVCSSCARRVLVVCSSCARRVLNMCSSHRRSLETRVPCTARSQSQARRLLLLVAPILAQPTNGGRGVLRASQSFVRPPAGAVADPDAVVRSMERLCVARFRRFRSGATTVAQSTIKCRDIPHPPKMYVCLRGRRQPITSGGGARRPVVGKSNDESCLQLYPKEKKGIKRH